MTPPRAWTAEELEQLAACFDHGDWMVAGKHERCAAMLRHGAASLRRWEALKVWKRPSERPTWAEVQVEMARSEREP